MTWTIKHMGRRLSKQTDLPVSVYVCACVSVICVLPCLLLLVLYGLLRLCLRPSVLLAGCLSICQSLSLPACRLPAYACAQLSGDCLFACSGCISGSFVGKIDGIQAQAMLCATPCASNACSNAIAKFYCRFDPRARCIFIVHSWTRGVDAEQPIVIRVT